MVKKNFEKANIFIILLILVMSLFVTTIIPPFQSPDEFDHVKRAYALSQGRVQMITPPEMSTGTNIDEGLISFIAIYEKIPFKYENKVSSEDISKVKLLAWSGSEKFSVAPGVNFYLPIIYFPHAIGLSLGQSLDLTVDKSYFLARYFSIATIFLILLVSARIYKINYLAFGLLLLPMTIFQFSSASMDGMATALSILVLSIFMKLSSELNQEKTADGYFYVMITCMAIVVMCRFNLLPLLLLPLYLSYRYKSVKHFLITVVAFLLIVSWLIHGLSTTVDNRVIRDYSTSSLIVKYISSPVELFNVLFNTLTNKEILVFYWESALGILGWLDHRISANAFFVLSVAIIIALIFSIKIEQVKQTFYLRTLLLLVSFSSMFLVFLILLVTWNAYPTETIQGVQGRYFLIPLLIASYAISTNASSSQPIVYGAILVIAITTIISLPSTLLDRYYIAASSLKVTNLDSTDSSEKLCVLDEPQNNSIIKVLNPIRLRGWAMDSNSMDIPENVTIQLVNTETGISLSVPAMRNERPDVAKAFNRESALMSGFLSVPLKPGAIPKGVYKVKIYQQNVMHTIGCQSINTLEFVD